MHDPGGLRAGPDDLLGCERIAHGAERIRGAIGDEIQIASGASQILGDPAEMPIAILVPGDVVNNGAVQAIKQDIARVLIARLGCAQPAAHDAEMAF